MSNDKRPTVIKRNELGEVKVYKKNEDGSLTETNDVVKEETFLNLVPEKEEIDNEIVKLIQTIEKGEKIKY